MQPANGRLILIASPLLLLMLMRVMQNHQGTIVHSQPPRDEFSPSKKEDTKLTGLLLAVHHNMDAHEVIETVTTYSACITDLLLCHQILWH